MAGRQLSAIRPPGSQQLREDQNAAGPLVEAYRRPVPLLAAGQALAPHAHAMMDVSDGLLLDAQRMAEASGCSAVIDLDALPLSDAFIAVRGDDRDARLFAATAGDDYALLAALSGAILNTFFTFRDHSHPASGDSPLALVPFNWSAAGNPSHCRRHWAMNIAAIPLRQWLIALSGLASGMAAALLLH